MTQDKSIEAQRQNEAQQQNHVDVVASAHAYVAPPMDTSEEALMSAHDEGAALLAVLKALETEVATRLLAVDRTMAVRGYATSAGQPMRLAQERVWTGRESFLAAHETGEAVGWLAESREGRRWLAEACARTPAEAEALVAAYLGLSEGGRLGPVTDVDADRLLAVARETERTVARRADGSPKVDAYVSAGERRARESRARALAEEVGASWTMTAEARGSSRAGASDPRRAAHVPTQGAGQ